MVLDWDKSGKLIDFPDILIDNHLLQIFIMVQFYSILQVTSSGAEYFLNVEFLYTTRKQKFSYRNFITCNLVPNVKFK